ncbi:hypothetical protein AAE02nite_16050 [Adhaeribacter aerolatus]|uniref:DUF4595 domain-containing protein n=1 Tax=Adhaeribacter aerolatus TaxID=670289 RepID=A0A512AW53_9BACT|nr:hypothetical protein [Adhaeribacter aerolatus]GEO03941.1 hypothetical protein AAE02nite_16050 [Adhaeribacter aerolatus]
MQKISTLLIALFMASAIFTSCKENEIDGPKTETDCATLKEWTDNQGKRVLLNQYAFNGDKISKMTHFGLDGKKTESLAEYDNQGRLVKISDKISSEGVDAGTQYLTTFAYYNDGTLSQTDYYKVEDGKNNLLQTRIFYYENNKVTKLVSSGGVHWRYEYNEGGNVTKTYFQPASGAEYLEEEYTAYDDKLLANSLPNVVVLQNISSSSAGLNFSKNNAIAYKVYNPDGSLKTAYSFNRAYNPAGSQTKVVNTTITGGTTATATVETEYPTCK